MRCGSSENPIWIDDDTENCDGSAKNTIPVLNMRCDSSANPILIDDDTDNGDDTENSDDTENGGGSVKNPILFLDDASTSLNVMRQIQLLCSMNTSWVYLFDQVKY